MTLIRIYLSSIYIKTKLKNIKLMTDKLKFEVVILICALLTGWACQTLIITELLSATTLYGCLLGILLSLYIMGLFSFLSIHGIDDKHSRKDAYLSYGFLAVVAAISMLLVIIFDVNNLICWIITCALWYLVCVIRHVMFWRWF